MSRRKMLVLAASVIAVLAMVSVVYLQGRGNEAQAGDIVVNAAFDALYPLVGGPVGTPYPYDQISFDPDELGPLFPTLGYDIARDPNDVPSDPLPAWIPANFPTLSFTLRAVATASEISS